MLVKVIDHKGKVWWVNPAYVRGLIDKGGDKTGIDVSGWSGYTRVNAPIDEVAGLMNLAMERLSAEGSAIAERAAQNEAEQQAAQAAVMASIVIGG